MQGNKQRSERNSPNRACMEIHHEFRAASKELEALQQLNKELWEMNEENKEGTWGEVQGNHKAMKIASNFTRILTKLVTR